MTAKKDFTYTEAGKFIDDFKHALQNGIHTTIKLAEIESVDLTSLQLLASAKSSFKKANIPLTITFTGNDEVLNLISKCGFEKITESNPVF